MCEKEFSKPRTDVLEVYCPECNGICELIEEDDNPRNFRPYDAQRENNQAGQINNAQTLINDNIMNRPQALQNQTRQMFAQQMIPQRTRVNVIYQMATPFQTFVVQPPGPQRAPHLVRQNTINMEPQMNMGVQQQHQQGSIPGNIFTLINPFGMMNPLGFPMQGNFFGDIEGRIIEEFLRNDPNRYGPPPAPEQSVNQLKEIQFNEENCQIKDCAVCQEDYKNGEILLSMPCEHIFHKDCVKKWLSMHNSCPVCRKALETGEMTDV